MTGKESAAGGANTLTDAQMRFLASTMKNQKTKPDVNWDAVAAESGGVTVKAVKERYRIMAIKFGWNSSNKSSEASASSQKKPTAGVAKRVGRVGAAGKNAKGKNTAAVEEASSEDNVAVKPEDDEGED
ncbi:unnamed protein product [Discula destructiva]